MSINFARRLQGYCGGLGMTETVRKMEPRDSVMLCNVRSLDEELATLSKKKKNTINEQDDLIRSKRNAVRIRTYLYSMDRLDIMQTEYDWVGATSAKMNELPKQGYTVDADLILFDLQRHWWRMFDAANILQKNWYNKRGPACHPSSLIALLAIENVVKQMHGITVWPDLMEALLEDAVAYQDHYCREFRRLNKFRIATLDVAGELIEGVLYTLIGIEMPEEMKPRPGTPERRGMLFM